MTDASRLKRLGMWLLQTTVFLLLPILVFHAGLSHIDQLRYEDRLLLVEQQVEETLASFAIHANTEEFMARTFRRAFLEMLAGNPVTVIREYYDRFSGDFDFMLWDASNRLLDKTVAPESFAGDWKLGLKTIREYFSRHRRHYEASDEEATNLRSLLGPQLLFSSMSDSLVEKNCYLLVTDSTGKKPRCWVTSFNGLTLVILVKQQTIKVSDIGLNYYLNHLHKSAAPFVLGFARKDQLNVTGEMADREQATEILAQHILKNGLKLQTAQAHYFMRVVENDLTLFACVSKESLSGGGNTGHISWLLVFLLLPYLCVSCWKELNHRVTRFSISRKLMLLFVYSSGLPLSMLFFVGYDYLAQKQHAMFDDIHAQGTNFLKNFDERFKSEEIRQVFNIRHALNDLKMAYRNRQITAPPFKIFADKVSEDLEDRHDLRLFVVASAAEFTGTNTDAYIEGKRIAIIHEEINARKRKKRKEEADAYTALIRFILSSLNGDAIEAKMATEIEMIAESVMQKSLLEVQNEFLQANGQITLMGLGTSRSHALIELLSLYTDAKYDFMMMVTWGTDILEYCYVRRQFLNASRNISNLHLGMINEESLMFFPTELAANNVLREYVRKFTHRPLPPRQFITINYQDYLVMGFRGKYMSYFNMFGLYPAQIIRDKIFSEKKRLISFGLASLILAMILGQLLSYSFLYPLKILAQGAEAIQQRNFDKRLPDLGRDEFGEMAQVFNTTMVDLEELKVAGAVQEHLLPALLPELDGCRIYARSFSRGDLGGDYYDCFLSSDGRFCLLSGDVSGHGAGAALIMAMAKAAIMKLENLHSSPCDLLLRIHQLIAATKQEQVKTMAFQFFNIDLPARKALYSNAGSWPPLLISHDQQDVSEISLPGPRLGALKKPQFKNIEVTFGSGETLLLYTDGLVKALDTRGQMIGIENLKKMAAANFDPCPQKFFDKLMDAHSQMTGQQNLQDDTTLIIVVFS